MTERLQMVGTADLLAVGVSRIQSKDRNTRPPNGDIGTHTNGFSNTMDTAHDHEPFTERDLALALSRSHLAVPTQG